MIPRELTSVLQDNLPENPLSRSEGKCSVSWTRSESGHSLISQNLSILTMAIINKSNSTFWPLGRLFALIVITKLVAIDFDERSIHQ